MILNFEFGKFITLMRAISFALLVIGVPAFAQSGPTKLNISGALFTPAGVPVTNSSVNFKLEVMDKNSTCVLYSEEHNGIDLSASKGGFALQIGDGTSAANNIDGTSPAALSAVVFKNSGVIAPFAGCAGGLTLNAGDERVIRVYYDLGGGFVAMNPDVPIASSAYAMVAETLQGKAASDFVQLRDDATYDLNQTNIESIFSAVNFAKLTQILSGNFGGTTVTNVGTPSAGTDATNKNYVDANIGGKIADVTGVGPATGNGATLIWDQALNRWVTGTPSATDNTKLPLAGGTMTGPIAMGGQNITNIGHMTMAAQRTLNLGTYTNAQETTLIAGLGAGDKGKIWFNSDANLFKVWDGSAAVSGFAPTGAAGGDLTGTYPNPTLASGVVATAELANDAVTSAKINNTGIAVNRLLITDATTGANVTYKTCALDESLKWTASGWACTTAAAFIGNTGVTAATYGNATQVSQVAVDAQGRITSASNVNIAFPVVSVAGKTGAVTLNTADISGLGTAAVKDFGTAAGNLVELDAGGKIPASLLPSTSGDIQDVVAGSGLTGGGSSGAVTLNVDTGTTAGKIVQLDSSARLPAVDGSLLTGIAAAQVSGAFANGGNAFGSAATLGTNDNFAMQFEANGSTTMTILPSGSIGIGTALPGSKLTVAGEGSSAAQGLLGLNYAYSSSGRPLIKFNKARGTLDTPLAVQNDDGLSDIISNAYINGAYNPVASVAAQVDGVPSATSYPARLVFSTTGDGEIVRSERMRISGNGFVGIGTASPLSLLHVNGIIRATDICDESGANCKDISGGWGGGGDIDGVYTGTGLAGGFASGSGTLSVDVGTTAGKIVQLDASAYLPTIDGRNLTNVNAVQLQARNVAATAPTAAQVLTWNASASAWEPQTLPAGNVGDMTSVSAGLGLTGGSASGDATLSVDVGTTADKIVQLDSSARLPAVDGSQLTGLSASQVAGAFANGGNNVTATATLGTNSNHALEIETNGTSVMSLLANGNIGIATTAPVDMLTVSKPAAVNDSTRIAVTTSGTLGNQQAVVNLVTQDNGAIMGTSAANKGWQLFGRGNAFSTGSQQNDFGIAYWSGGGWSTPLQIDSATGYTSLGTGNAPSRLTVEGSMALDQLGADPAGAAGYGTLFVRDDGKLYYRDGTGSIKDLSATGNGSVTSVVAGGGLTGGNITATGTLAVDTGTTAGKIVQLDASARLPAVNGSQLTDITASQISGVFADGGNTFTADATLGTNSNHALNIEANGATAMTVLPGGNVGIGTTSPSTRFYVTESYSGAATTKQVAQTRLNYTPSAAPGVGTVVQALRTKITTGGTSDLSNVDAEAIQTTVEHNQSTTLAGAISLIGDVENSSTGSIADARGTFSEVENLSSGSITNGYGVWARVQNESTGSITNAYAGNFEVLNSTGTVTNGYGVYIANIQATNKFGLYQADATANNYFAGSLGVGTSTVRSSLSIAGSGSLGLEASDTDLQAGDTVGAIQFRSNESSTTSPPADDIVAQISAVANAQHTGGYWPTDLIFSTVNGSNVLSESMRIKPGGNVGIGTNNPQSLLHVNGVVRATDICDENGANCKDISGGWGGGGDIDGVYTGTGLAGGFASGSGTLSVDVGTTAGKIVQLDASAYLPAIDGRNLTNVNAAQLQTRNVSSTAPTANQVLKWNAGNSTWEPTAETDAFTGTVTSVVSGTGLTGGNITSAGTLAVDVGTTAGKIVQLDASAYLPAIDGRNLTNVNAALLQTRNVASTAPTAAQVLGWNAANSQWEPQTFSVASGGGFVNGGNSFGGVATLGTNDANELNFETNNSTVMTIGSNGNIGLWTAPNATNKIYADAPNNSTAASDQFNYLFNTSVNPASGLTNRRYSLGGSITASGTQNKTYIVGASGTANNDSTAGNTSMLLGVEGWAQNSSTGSVSYLAGVNGGYGVYNGTVNRAMGGYTWAEVSGGAVTDAYGLRIEQYQSGAGTITNRYGIHYTPGGTATNDYGFYISGSGLRNYISGSLGVGHTNPQAKIHVIGQVRVDQNSNDAWGQHLRFYKDRAGAVVQDGDELGVIGFYGNDGAANRRGSYILSKVTGTPGASDMPASLSFHTTADGNPDSTERMTIRPDGKIGIGTNSPGESLDVNGGIAARWAYAQEAGAGVYPNLGVNAVTDSGEPQMVFKRGRGTVMSSPAAALDGDNAGSIHGRVFNGTQYEGASAIVFQVDGTNVTGAGNHPGGSIHFNTRGTSATGQYSTSPVMTIRNSGYVGIGLTAPQAPLHVQGIIRATDICDENGANCKDISGGWGSGGDIDGVYTTASTGLLGGFVSGSGTLSIDVGTTANKIVQLDSSARIPAVNGSLLTNVNAVQLQARNVSSTAPTASQVLAWNALNSSWEPKTQTDSFTGTVTSVVSGMGLTGGNITSTGTLAVDTGTTANKIVQLDSSARLPAINGSQLTNVNAVQLQARNVASTAPTASQVLAWNAGNSTWEPQTVSASSSGGFVNNGNSFAGTATIGTNDANNLVIETSGNPQTTFHADGDITFGDGSSLYGGQKKFVFFSNPYNETNDFIHINNDAYFNQDGNTGTVEGMRNWIRSNAPNSHNNMYAARNRIDHWGAGSLANGVGSYNEVVNNGAPLTNATGSLSRIEAGANTTTNAYGFRAQIAGAGTVTNSHGLYIDSLIGTNRWGVYQAGSADNNYFAGNVGIGTANPGQLLDVVKAQNGQSTIRVTNADAGALAIAKVSTSNGTNEGYLQTWGTASGGATGVGAVTGDLIADSGDSSIRFRTNWNEKMRIANNGNVGIGTTAPSYKLEVSETVTNTGNWWVTSAVDQTYNPSSAPGAPSYIDGHLTRITTAGTSNLSNVNLEVANTQARHNVATTLGYAAATNGVVYNLAGGTITSSRGVLASSINSSTGTITGATGLVAEVKNENAGGTIGTAYGLYASIMNSGTINTGYGLYLGNIQATAKWGVYQTDSTSPNYFNGVTTVGTTTAGTGNKFTVEGGAIKARTGSGAGQGGEVRFEESSGAGNNYIALRAPDSIGATETWILPSTAPTNGQVLSWTTGGQLSWASVPATGGTIAAGAGSAAAPSVSFSGDPDTGFYNTSSNNTISVTTGNSNIFNFSSSGLVSPTTGGAAITTANGVAATPTYTFSGDTDTGWYRHAADTLAASTAGSRRMLIAPNGNVSIGGGTTPFYKLEVADSDIDVRTRIWNDDSTVARYPGFMVQNHMGAANSGAPDIFMSNSRGTGGAPTPVQTGDILGMLTFAGERDNAYALNYGARISAVAAENFSGTAGGTNLTLSTIANGSTSLSERMRIQNNGYVGIGTNAPNSWLHVERTDASTATGAFSGSKSTMRVEPSTAHASGAYRQADLSYAYVPASVTANIDAVKGNYGMVENYSGGNSISSLIASQAWAYNFGNANVNYLSGNWTGSQVAGGTVSLQEGIGIRTSISGGTTTSQYGISITMDNTGGTLANRRALYLVAPTGTAPTTSDYAIYQAGSSSRNYFAGNVGIGSTTAPQGKLEVTSGADFRSIILGTNVADGADNGSVIASKRKTQSNVPFAALATWDWGTERKVYIGGGNWNMPSATQVSIYAQPSYDETTNTYEELFQVDGGGYTNIYGPWTSFNRWGDNTFGHWQEFYKARGTRSAPTAVLSGDDLGNIWAGAYNGTNWSSNGGARISFSASENQTATNGGTRISFHTTPNGSQTISTAMTISDQGYVGIGTTSPGTGLHVVGTGMRMQRNNDTAGNGAAISLYRSRGTSSSPAAVQTGDSLGEVWGYGHDGSAYGSGGGMQIEADGNWTGTSRPNRLKLFTTPTGATANSTRMTILENGNVGINTTAPTHRLHVIGTAGLSTGTAWTNTSDLRLKDVHGEYKIGLQEILKLKTVRFSYKKNNPLGLESDRVITGFVAQEVQQVIPEAVNIREDGYLELNVDPIHWATVNAVQELHGLCQMSGEQSQELSNRVAQHDREITTLKRQVQSLKEENAALKEAVCEINPNANICK